MGSLSPIHWLIVIVVLVLLFGAKRLPDASRSVGRSLRIFKSEMKHMAGDGEEGTRRKRRDHSFACGRPRTTAASASSRARFGT